MTTATMTRPSAVPKAGGSGRAIALALLMHLLLGGLLFFGIRWQSSPPEVVQAELWSATPQTAAPAPRPAVIQPAPPPKVEAPKPEPKPDPLPEPPKMKVDIAEKAPPKVEPPKKKEPVKVEAPKPQPKPQPPAPRVETKVSPELLKLQQQAAVEAPQRPPSELSSLLAAAGKEGKDTQTSGPRGRDSYIARLVTAIRSQMRYPASASGNPFVTMWIEQLPNGEVTSVTVRKPSGVPAFDEAVERAIRAASPLPRDEQGKVERKLELDYKMYEKN